MEREMTDAFTLRMSPLKEKVLGVVRAFLRPEGTISYSREPVRSRLSPLAQVSMIQRLRLYWISRAATDSYARDRASFMSLFDIFWRDVAKALETRDGVT